MRLLETLTKWMKMSDARRKGEKQFFRQNKSAGNLHRIDGKKFQFPDQTLEYLKKGWLLVFSESPVRRRLREKGLESEERAGLAGIYKGVNATFHEGEDPSFILWDASARYLAFDREGFRTGRMLYGRNANLILNRSERTGLYTIDPRYDFSRLGVRT